MAAGPLARRESRRFLLFALPWVIGFVFFSGGPIIASIAISFTQWDLLGTPRWIGLDNYDKLLGDDVFWTALDNTLYFGAGSAVLSVIVNLAMALLLNMRLRGQAIFRTIIYMPSVLSGIATALLWIHVLHPDYGLINHLLGSVGIQGPGWLIDQDWAVPGLILMSVWTTGNAMIIFLAGLQGVPVSLYEAAQLDGAGWWSRFRHVTVPMMSPVIFFNLVVGFIGSLQAFQLILFMTDGAPGNASLVLGLYVYRYAFKFFDMGYASTIAWALFFVVIVFTALQFLLARRWVHYEHR
ncbi:carbohydrate ABC transporter permease [Nonomuraea soli]|uniref:Multiple sugar transport system permease protein n=1 Tax=Nonomuraea soli TaxID=1032476 RepID=A0A7W0HNA8_9ACTN|nr:sugar ABC transporter permease [Nonomuraea soli]MBA2889599.1 multiple sugar transport system permease protein [Nonomuraea soli]